MLNTTILGNPQIGLLHSSPLGGSGYRILTGVAAQSPPILLGNDGIDEIGRKNKTVDMFDEFIMSLVESLIQLLLAKVFCEFHLQHSVG